MKRASRTIESPSVHRHTPQSGRASGLAGALATLAMMTTATVGCAGGGKGGSDGAPASPSAIAGRYIIAIGDAHMDADAFVSRSLGSFDPYSRDNLTIVTLPIQEPNTPFAQLPVSNSALATPACLTVSNDGRFAYVVEARGPAPDSAMTLDDLPPGENLTVVSLRDPLLPEVVSEVYVGTEPTSVSVRETGDLAAIATRTPGQQIVIVVLRNGVPVPADNGEPDVLAWPLLGVQDGSSARPSSVHWLPGSGDSAALAVTVPDRGEVMFYRVQRDAGEPTLAPWGDAVACGRYIQQGVFTPDGRYFIALDRGERPDPDRLSVGLNPGGLSVIRVGSSVQIDSRTVGLREPHTVVSTTRTSPVPVGITISSDGRLIATTSLHRSTGTQSIDGLSGGAIQLHRFDPARGTLNTIGEFPVNGVPGGVSFDASDRFVTVTQFRSFDPSAIDGELAFWRVLGTGDQTRLEAMDFFVGLGKGPHAVRIVR